MESDKGFRETLADLRAGFDGLQAKIHAELIPWPFGRPDFQEYKRLATRAWNLAPDELHKLVAKHEGQPWERWTSLAAQLNRSGVCVPTKVDSPEQRTVAAWCGASVLAIDTILSRPTSKNPPDVAYLGVDLRDREASRVFEGKTLGPVKFEGKGQPWKLFTLLVKAGPDGITCNKVKDAIGGTCYNHKGMLVNLLQPLKLDVTADGKQWTLVHL